MPMHAKPRPPIGSIGLLVVFAVLCGNCARLRTAYDPSVRTDAEQLTELHRTKDWKQEGRLMTRLLAGDRQHAARVLSVVLQNRQIETRTHIIARAQEACLKEMVPTLVFLLNDPDSGVRCWSSIALGTLGDAAVVASLEKRLLAEPDDQTRYRIRVALGRLGRPYLGYFIAGLSDWGRSRWSIVALGELRDKRAVPYLVRLLDSTDTWTPWYASESIKRITGIENVIVTDVTNDADGGASTSGKRRPLTDIRAECIAWMGRHRKEVFVPIERPPEPWVYTCAAPELFGYRPRE